MHRIILVKGMLTGNSRECAITLKYSSIETLDMGNKRVPQLRISKI
jgi:hypothetical protein